jgi:hypothetical protein
MILSEQHIQSITNEDGVYQCGLINRRFAHLFFGEDTSPIGNVVVFESKTEIGSLSLENALVVCGELPNTSMFGGVCFQRLYATQIGSLLSVITGKECFVDESCIFTDGVQASLSITNRIKDSITFHIIFPTDSAREELCSLALKQEDMNAFKENAIEAFKHLTKSIFLETQRDNF